MAFWRRAFCCGPCCWPLARLFSPDERKPLLALLLVESGAADAYRLKVVIRNAGAIPLALPSLELTLTDTQDQAQLRRVLTPAELGATGPTLAAGAGTAATAATATSATAATGAAATGAAAVATRAPSAEATRSLSMVRAGAGGTGKARRAGCSMGA